MQEAVETIYPMAKIEIVKNLTEALSQTRAMTCFLAYPVSPRMGSSLIEKLPKMGIKRFEDSTIERWREEAVISLKACLKIIEEAQERDKP